MRSAIRPLALLLIASGMLLDSYAMIFKSSHAGSALTLALMLWLWVPYLVCAGLALRGRATVGVFLAVAMIFALDLTDYRAVFVAPKHSTAALGLFFAPLWDLFIAIPLGLFGGWLVGRRLT